jgi:enolase
MLKIKEVKALEILDSRGKPTIKSFLKIEGQSTAFSASVPSGASTGENEAIELRDRNAKRYGGNGCLKAIELINQEINKAVSGKEFESQKAFDNYLCQLDGTNNKRNLGGNTLLALSVVFSKAFAGQKGIPLFSHFAQIVGNKTPKLPQLTVNLFSGGKHAGLQTPIQDILLVPKASTVQEALAMTYNVYYKAAENLKKTQNMRLLRADEGGLSPACDTVEELFDHAMKAIFDCGYTSGKDFSIAIDVASSHFYENGEYHFYNKKLSSLELIDKLVKWQADYPLVSIEDGLDENDWQHWPLLVKKLGAKCDIMGDDLLCTNIKLIEKAQQQTAATALLLKMNQIGTVTEALEAFQLAKSKNWRVTASARSGETEDNWLADLAYGISADYIKIGSITQSERLAKYNRLLEIENHFY